MKKQLFILLALFTLSSCQYEDEIYDIIHDQKTKKVNVCHYDSKTDKWISLNISKRALQAHLKHGDLLGNCEELYTYVPDDAFEWALIYDGYDDVMDDYVLTKNIYHIERLSFCEALYCRPFVFPERRIMDLTGIQDFNNLKYFSLGEGHRVKNLDFSGNLKLEFLSLSENDYWETLDLSKNSWLREIYLTGRPPVESLDFSSHKKLVKVVIDLYNLKVLNLKNGKNTKITLYDVVGWQALECVQVDDSVWSENNWTTESDKDYIFSEDCGY